MPKPNFFIVGAPKCGTTAMYEYLRAHPDIYMPEESKEPHYFAPDHQTPRMQVYREEAAYLALFDAATTEKCIGEASVRYLSAAGTAERIHAFAPEAKIIIMLRNPIELLYAIYFQLRYGGLETIPTFEGALAAEPERRQLWEGGEVEREVVRLFYSDVVNFAEQVQHYRNIFGEEQVHVILYDDFRADTATAYADTLRFLGVDSEFQPAFVRFNASKRARSYKLQRFLHRPPQWYRNLRQFARKNIAQQTRQRASRLIHYFNVRQEARPPMNPQTREHLRTELRPMVVHLSDLLGRDLRYWLHSSISSEEKN